MKKKIFIVFKIIFFKNIHHSQFGNKNIHSSVKNIHQYFLLTGPFVALIGNAASDIWLSLISVYFISSSFASKDWEWTKAGWFRATLIFWLWLIFSGLFSEWPQNAVSKSLLWIRFPVFAVAMSTWLQQSDLTFRRMFYYMMLGSIIMACFLLAERTFDPYATRLFGTWGQHPKAGWYMLGMALPVILIALNAQYQSAKNLLWAIPIIVLFLGTTIDTGEVYTTISMLFGIFLYILLSRQFSIPLLAMLIIFIAIAAIVLATNDYVSNRYLGTFLSRLPWYPTSDYYPAWFGGINTGLQNPLFGIGANNYEVYCDAFSAEKLKTILKVKKCMNHPHNLYLQIFAEAGFIGLLLFSVLVALLLIHTKIIKAFRENHIPRIIAFSILLTTFWPVSSYSDMFGQHKNMFTWFLVAWSLSLISRQDFNSHDKAK